MSNTKETSNPSTWSINQVEQWLKTNYFHDYVDILCHQNHIDGKRLMSLDQNEILSLTKNQKLCSKIQSLKSSLSPPSPSPSSSSSTTTIDIEPIIITPPTLADLIEDQPLANCCFITSIRSDRKKTLLAFLLLACTIFFCSFIITIVDERLPDPKHFPPLPDLILENIEQIPWAFAVTEKIIVIEMTTLFTIILLHRHR